MKCPSCGAEASGKFCSSCGTKLQGESCTACGSTLLPGAKFCNNCGAPAGRKGGAPAGSNGQAVTGRGRDAARKEGLRAHPGRAGGRPGDPGQAGAPQAPPPRAGDARLAWWVAGGALVVLLVVLGYPVLTGSSDSGSPGVPGGAPAPSQQAVDLTTMSLEEQATRLFNRVMMSSSAGDTADVAFFLPKALTIYEQLAPSDPDGIYHVVLLLLVGGDHEGALAKAQEGLAQEPDYLLLLASAAEAAAGLGDDEAAVGYFTHFLRVYDSEMGQARPGYDHHSQMLPVYRETAQAFVGQR